MRDGDTGQNVLSPATAPEQRGDNPTYSEPLLTRFLWWVVR